MAYAIEEIVEALKAARLGKGLSQRDLGQRVGLPQSHVSKIEKGGTDIKLSSLIEIARALDLEIKLVPRAALPAVDTLVKAPPQQSESPVTSRALDRIRRAQQVARRVAEVRPNVPALSTFQQNLTDLERLRFHGPDLSALSKALEPVERLNRRITELDAPFENRRLSDFTKPFRQSSRSLERLRNRIVHSLPEPRQIPAYRLDEDEDG